MGSEMCIRDSPEIRKLSGTIRMVLDIIGENHRTRYGIKEEFHMTEECAMYLYEGIQTMNKIIEKLEKKIPKWIRNKLEETRSVLECFFHQDKKYVLHLKQDHDHRIILCASSRRIPQYLDQMLWSRGMGAILTSGTLKTGQGFSHIRKMTGLQRVRRVREYVADSPFEYQKNCLLYLPKNLKKYMLVNFTITKVVMLTGLNKLSILQLKRSLFLEFLKAP